MFTGTFPYTIYPLGDSALTLDWGPVTDIRLHRHILGSLRQLQAASLPGIVEWVPAYSTLTGFYDIPSLRKQVHRGQSAFRFLSDRINACLHDPVPGPTNRERRLRIPVCYDPAMAPDLEKLAAAKNMEPAELVRLHTSEPYHVYLLGFLPGFAYMGFTPPALDTPRKPQPVPTAAGSVGLAGRQTGIYPLDSPGGWSIIGKTPLRLFDPGWEQPVLFQPGDTVEFFAIGRNEFPLYSSNDFNPVAE